MLCGLLQISFGVMSATETSKTVYVSSKGTDGNRNGTKAKPYLTIKFAVEKAKASNPNNIVVVVLDSADFDCSVGFDGLLTVCGESESSDSSLQIKSNNSLNSINSKTCLLKTNLKFENIKLLSALDNENKPIKYLFVTQGKKLVFGKGVSFDQNSLSVFAGKAIEYGDASFNQDLEVNSLSCSGKQNTSSGLKTFVGTLPENGKKDCGKSLGDVNITINSGDANRVVFTDTETTYDGDVVIDWKADIKSNDVPVIEFDNNTNNSTFNKTLQIIIDNNATQANVSSAVRNATVKNGKWIMLCQKEAAHLETTDTAGKFKVVGDLEAKAVSVNNSEEKYYSKSSGDEGEVFLDLSSNPGEYIVSFSIPENDYEKVYVSSIGSDSNDGLTAKTPLATINRAIDFLNQSTSNVRNICISGTVEFDGGKKHDKMITIVGDETGTAVLKAVKSNVFEQLGSAAQLNGPITFENLTIDENGCPILTNGNELIFGSGVGKQNRNFYIGNSDNSSTCDKSEKVVVNSWSGANWNGIMFNVGAFGNKTGRSIGNVDIELNGGYYKLIKFFSDGVSYDGNVNLTYNSGNLSTNGLFSITYSGTPVTFNKSLQIIANNDINDQFIVEKIQGVTAKGGKWLIFSDKSGGTLSTTDTSGKFKVNGDKIAEATERTSKITYYSNDGIITLPAGTYDVTYVNEYPASSVLAISHSDDTVSTISENVKLTQGQNYNFSFNYLDGFNQLGKKISVVVMDSNKNIVYSSDNTIVLSEENATLYNRKYSFTHSKSTGEYSIGFRISGNYQFAVSDLFLNSTSKPNENLLTNGNLSNHLNGWNVDGVAAKNNVDTFSLTNTLIEIQKSDKTCFNKFTARTLHVDLNGFVDSISTYVSLKQGKKYKLSMYYNFDKGGLYQSVDISIASKNDKTVKYYGSNLTDNKKMTASYEDDVYKYIEYTFTSYTPDDVYSLRFDFSAKTIADFYRISLTEISDSETNLVSNGNFVKDLSDWYIGDKSIEAGKQYYNFYSTSYELKASLRKYNEKTFKYPTDEDLGPKKILSLENFTGYRSFQQRIYKLIKPNTKYIYEVSISSQYNLKAFISHKGERSRLFDIDPVHTTVIKVDTSIGEIEYKKYVFEFTTPETIDNQVFVGIQFASGQMAYIFDSKVYAADDSKKKNLFENADFRLGLNEWIWGWAVWFNHDQDTTDLQRWETSAGKLILYDYDYANLVTYYNDKYFSDGKWWNDKDYEESKPEIANVKGLLKESNGNIMSGVKLLMSSTDSDVISETDSKGNFNFGDIVAGLYELFAIDSSGELYKITTINIVKNGKYDLNLSCDTTNVVLLDEYMEDEDDEIIYEIDEDQENTDTKKGSATIKGTVYTPDKKTVARLKLYLNDDLYTVSDANGEFSFNSLPAGDYTIYLKGGNKKIVLKTIQLQDNTIASVKLKFDISKKKNIISNEDDFPWWIVVVSVSAVLVVIGTILLIFVKRKTRKNK